MHSHPQTHSHRILLPFPKPGGHHEVEQAQCSTASLHSALPARTDACRGPCPVLGVCYRPPGPSCSPLPGSSAAAPLTPSLAGLAPLPSRGVLLLLPDKTGWEWGHSPRHRLTLRVGIPKLHSNRDRRFYLSCHHPPRCPRPLSERSDRERSCHHAQRRCPLSQRSDPLGTSPGTLTLRLPPPASCPRCRSRRCPARPNAHPVPGRAPQKLRPWPRCRAAQKAPRARCPPPAWSRGRAAAAVPTAAAHLGMGKAVLRACGAGTRCGAMRGRYPLRCPRCPALRPRRCRRPAGKGSKGWVGAAEGSKPELWARRVGEDGTKGRHLFGRAGAAGAQLGALPLDQGEVVTRAQPGLEEERRPAAAEPALRDDGDAVPQQLRFVHVVRGEDDGAPWGHRATVPLRSPLSGSHLTPLL